MSTEVKLTVSARVSPRVRQLSMAAARLGGMTLSGFVALAMEEAARRELVGDSTATEERATERGAPSRNGLSTPPLDRPAARQPTT